MEHELQNLETEARESLQGLDDKTLLEDFRIRFLGRKGKFSTIMRQLGTVAADDRPRMGQLANSIKAEIEKLFEDKQQSLNDAVGSSGSQTGPDLTLPGRYPASGKLHPVTQVMQETCAIFENLGFSVAEGPDIELDYYNFEALNIPAHHPARDMHDTFYVLSLIHI